MCESCCKKDIDEKEKDRMWDLLIHTEKILTDRTNFFLVAQSMFLVGYATLIIHQPQPKPPLLIFILGGGLTALVWLIIQQRTYDNVHELLSIVDAESNPWFPSYHQWKKEIKGCFSVNWVITKLLPILFLGIWLFLLAFLYKDL